MGHAATIDRSGNRVSASTHNEWLEATIVNGPLQATFCELWRHLKNKRLDATKNPEPSWLAPYLAKYNESYVVEGFFVSGYITILNPSKIPQKKVRIP